MIITAGKYKGRKIKTPDEKIVRPTLSKIRESIFSTLYSIMDFEDKSFLDVFAGSGIMGLEAISRGFEKVTAIEKNPKVASVIKENYNTIGIKPDLIIGDSLKKIQSLNQIFDVIYIDPPYYAGIYETALEKVKEFNIADKNSVIILEHAVEINWQELGFQLIKQKKYADKFLTFLEIQQ